MIEEDLKIAYNWFTHPNGNHQVHLNPNSQHIEAIRTALSTHSLDQARRISRNLHFSTTENRLEVGEILVWAAVYAVHLGQDERIKEEHIQFAKEQFQNAAAKYSDEEPHYRAITLWLLGLIYWHLPEYKRHAIYHWEYSLRVLTHLSYSQESLNPAWYQDIRFKVVETLFHARMFRRHLSIKDVKYFRISSPKRQQASKDAGVPISKPKSPRKPINIRSLPVYQYVPAGGWGVVDPVEIGQTESDQFIINDISYQATDLIGRGQITIQEREQYAMVRIKGESMNKLDIQKDDYVLIHRQEVANHTDIVLAERINLDPEATLKRLYWQGNTIELQPESDDPSHPILPVDKRDNLRILGVAIAIFKPVPPEEPTSETPASPKTPPSKDDKDEKVIRVKLDW